LKGGAKEKNTKQNIGKASLPKKEWVSELRSHLRGRRRSNSPPRKGKKKSLRRRRRRRDMEQKRKPKTRRRSLLSRLLALPTLLS
jgi:hypothetical protein